MSTAKKLMGTTDLGGFTAIEDVFSTYLYTGNSSTQTITNGIDLAGEGGLIWLKSRSSTTNPQYRHALFDTERGVGASTDYVLRTDGTDAQNGISVISALNSDGWDFGGSNPSTGNNSGDNYASWTFRKAPRFFDVVTYTGTGSGGFEVAHNLGQDVGFIAIKRTDSTSDWTCWHTGRPNSYLVLNSTAAEVTTTSSVASRFGDNTSIIQPTSTNFTLGGTWDVNQSGGTYVAYLFAHDPLGPSGDGSDGLIACGSYVGTGAAGNFQNLGWEPQYVLVKGASAAGYNWIIHDVMRGMSETTSYTLKAESSGAENLDTPGRLLPRPTGFEFSSSGLAANNASGSTYIYIAIRRGPMRQPESATDVFDAIARSGTGANATITTDVRPDTVLIKRRSGLKNWFLTPRAFSTNSSTSSKGFKWDLNGTSSLLDNVPVHSFTNTTYSLTSDGGQNGSGDTYMDYIFKRAPAFFDYCTYDGDGTSSQTVPHGLTVVPEMICTSMRTNTSGNTARRFFYHKDLGNTSGLWMDDSVAERTGEAYWASTTPTESNFYVGDANSTNCSGDTYFAVLFASLAGISKVGSYTGNGSSQTIDCGFTSGARFVLIKRTDSTGDWYVWDTERGIVAANDPHLSLSTTAAEVTTDDSVDPDSSGFIVNQVAATNINVSSASYIFYAIA